jgi:hypothetical protein
VLKQVVKGKLHRCHSCPMDGHTLCPVQDIACSFVIGERLPVEILGLYRKPQMFPLQAVRSFGSRA